MLTYNDVKASLPDAKGIKEADFSFECIVFQSSESQQKGLFVSSNEDADLQKAISNGAIAAVWPVDKELPFYTPNHFPVFFTNNPIDAIIELTEKHKTKLSLEGSSNKTKVKLPQEGVLSKETVQLLREFLNQEKETHPGKGRDRK